MALIIKFGRLNFGLSIVDVLVVFNAKFLIHWLSFSIDFFSLNLYVAWIVILLIALERDFKQLL